MSLNPYLPPHSSELAAEHRDRLTTFLLRTAESLLALGILLVLTRGFAVTFWIAALIAGAAWIASYVAVESANPRLDRKSAIGLSLAAAVFFVHVSLLSEARHQRNVRYRETVERLRERVESLR